MRSSDTRPDRLRGPRNTAQAPLLGDLGQARLVQISETAPNSSQGDCPEPLGGDAVEISPAPNILGREAQVLGERDYPLGDTAFAPALDDINTFHVTWNDTNRVGRQHDRRRDSRQSGPMSPGSRLRNRRKAAHLSVEQMVERTGFAASTIRAHENGQNGLTAKAAEVYAKVLSTTGAEILFGHAGATPVSVTRPPATKDRQQEVDRVPVVGSIRAGAWTEIRDGEEEVTDWIYFNDPEYRRATKFALVVEGPSMNVYYPDGSKVVCVPAAEAGVREGDHVVVRRRQGLLVETTLKEVVVDQDGGYWLWPRSYDEAFQTPIRIAEAGDSDEGAEIAAVVIGKYENKRAGQGPLLMI